MKDLLMWIVVIIGTLALLFWVVGEANEKQANRLYARAHLSEVQNEGRKDLMAGLMPYVVVSLAVVGGTIVCVAIIRRPVSPHRPERIIETRTILIIQPGQHSRREIYKLLNE